MKTIKTLKIINYSINILIGLVILTGTLFIMRIILEEPHTLGVWIGKVIEGVRTIIGK